MSSAKDQNRALTAKQLALLNFVTEFMAAHHGMAPTIRECALHFGKCDATIHAHLLALQRKHFLQRSCRARSIVPAESSVAGALRYVPLFSKLNAGSDFARQTADSYILVVLPESRKPYFAVRMADDFLHDVGIYEGDLVIAEWCAVPEIGDLVITGTSSAGIRVERFRGMTPYRNIFGVVLSIQRFYR